MTDDEFSKLLAKTPRPEASPPTNCPECGHVVRPYYKRCPKCEGARNRKAVDATAVVIKQLKASRNPEEERVLLKQLDAMGHPDVNGLVLAIRNRLSAGGSKPRRAGGI